MRQKLDKQEVLQVNEQSLAHLRSIYGDETETVIADARYGFISGLLKDVLKKPPIERLTLSDKIDGVVVNRWLGIPLFLGIMYVAFQFVFTLSVPFMDWINAGFGWLAGLASGISGWGGSLLADGIIGGVGSVVIFVPPIFLLFVAIAVVEDCGYMARAAFVMDRVMHKVGLHGRSFIPMILGFGCNIPGVMAARTIENPKDRLTTILINPFMSCGARLPIFVLLAGYFFSAHAGLAVFSMYIIGIIVAVIAALVFRKILFRGVSSHFVMELPPYRLPTVKGVLTHMWERGRLFLRKAGTIIFGVVVLVWLLDYTGALEPIGRIIAPIFAPCGFGQWQAAVSLFFGFLAKEVVVGTMGTLFAAEKGVLGGTIAAQLGWTPLIAFAFMVFCLLYVPCVATIATIKSETSSWRWPIFAIFYTTAIAWIVATLIFQIGSLFVG
jgi:ferrous iron transport protein B